MSVRERSTLRLTGSAKWNETRQSQFMHDLLRAMVAKKASDLFITAGFPPALKVDGKMTPVSNQTLTPQHTTELARAMMNDKQAGGFEATKECNFAISPRGIGRFRVNAFVQQGRVGMVLRTITTDDPEVRGSEPAAGAERRRDDQARPRHHASAPRAPGKSTSLAAHDRLPQREQLRPHHHDRGPGRVRARAQELRHHAARGRRGHRLRGTLR